MMDWENKFSSIVRDTEASIAKVKSHLNSPATQRLSYGRAVSSYQPSYGSGYLSKDPYKSPAPSKFCTDLGSYQTSTPKVGHLATSPPTSPKYTRMTFDVREKQSSLDSSPAIVSLLQEKLDDQKKMIDSLCITVQNLQHERERDNRQIKTLQDELSSLHSRVSERGVDLETERKVESWKRTMMLEMQGLQNQLQFVRGREEESTVSASQISDLIREIHQQKRITSDEVDSLRREMENLKTRIMKVELGFGNMSSENRDFEKRYDRLERNLMEVSDSQKAYSRDVSRTLSEKDHEKAQISQLRSHISSLRDKISTLEEDLYKSSSANYHNLPSKKNSSKKKGISEKRFQKVSLANPIVSPANSDLDLSTSSSSSTSLADFSASEISSYTTKNKQQVSAFTEELSEGDSQAKSLNDPDSLSLDDL